MTKLFAKPQEARQCEARARARTLGVRVAVVSEARSYVSNSQTTPGVTYRIERARFGWSCECEGYQFTGMCKHLGAVERRAAREGWSFGTVCPLPGNVVPIRQPLSPERRAAIELDLYGA